MLAAPTLPVTQDFWCMKQSLNHQTFLVYIQKGLWSRLDSSRDSRKSFTESKHLIEARICVTVRGVLGGIPLRTEMPLGYRQLLPLRQLRVRAAQSRAQTPAKEAPAEVLEAHLPPEESWAPKNHGRGRTGGRGEPAAPLTTGSAPVAAAKQPHGAR